MKSSISKSLMEAIRKVVTKENEVLVEHKVDPIYEAYASMNEKVRFDDDDDYENLERKARDKKKDLARANRRKEKEMAEEVEESFEVYDLTGMLEEGEGVLKGLPDHIKKAVTGRKYSSDNRGGENSEVVDHGPIKSHSNLRGVLSNAMKNRGTHVLYHNGNPIGAVHQSDNYGARPKFKVKDETGEKHVLKREKVHGTGRYVGNHYIPYQEREHKDFHHSKGEAIDKMVYHVTQKHLHGDDLDDKSTFKKHHFELKTFGHDKNREEVSKARKDNRPNPGHDTLHKIKAKAIDKMADRHVPGAGAKEKAHELHKAIGHAIEAGDVKAARDHMASLEHHMRQHGLSHDSSEKSSYKRALERMSSRDSWDKQWGRKDMQRLKDRGIVKEEVELSEEELARLAEIEASFDEDVEQIDEISKKTLGSYIKRATDSAVNHAVKSTMHDFGSDGADVGPYLPHTQKWSKEGHKNAARYHAHKGVNREEGIKKAAKRLAKEDVETSGSDTE